MSAVTETASVTVLVALASGAGAFGGAAFSTWWTHRTGEQQRRREQQQRDAATIGPVMGLLADADPQRLTMNLRRDPMEQAAINRLDQFVGQLLVMAAGHPDDTVRASCRELSVSLRNAHISAMYAVTDFLSNRQVTGSLKTAKDDHDTARRVVERLLEEVARYGSGRRQVTSDRWGRRLRPLTPSTRRPAPGADSNGAAGDPRA
jgi:hypothetical protein